MPNSLDVLFYVDALTRFSPMAFTLPIHRGNCSWHFHSEAMWGFDGSVANGLFSDFMLSPNPMSSSANVLGLYGLKGMREGNIWKFLRFVTSGINRLQNFLIDPRNFISAGKVDFLKQVQAHGAFHLLFSDIAAMNYSTAAHQRISFAMSALDKFANLRVKLGMVPSDEQSAFKGLCSNSQKESLIATYQMGMGESLDSNLCTAFVGSVEKCFDALHADLDTQIDRSSEGIRLDRLWSQRNMRHGTFLMRGQFEKLFLETHGNVPATLGSLPFLLMLGLLIAPAGFLNFAPNISTTPEV